MNMLAAARARAAENPIAGLPHGNLFLFTPPSAVDFQFILFGEAPKVAITNLQQFKSDATSTIPEGGTITEDTVVFSAILQSSSTNPLRLEVEYTTSTFTGIAKATSSPVSPGSVATTTATGLVDGNYRWLGRGVDTVTNAVSEWQEFKTPGNTDFVVHTVPLYTQRESDFPSRNETKGWADRPYANGRGALGNEPCGLRIEQCGCAITSAVMTARFYDVTEAQGQDVQPLNLNNWLNDNNGYGDFGGFSWSALDRYTNYRVEYVRGEDIVNNFAVLNQHLRAGEPLIAKMSAGRGGPPTIAPDHFLVIGSRRTDGSYRVRDPFWFNTDKLTATTTNRDLALRNYEGGFDGLRIYKKGDGVAKSSLSVSIASPAELFLTDPLGRRTGKDPITGATFSEVPHASYFADAIGDPTGERSPTGHVAKTVYLPEPLDGDYTVQVIGVALGSYILTTSLVNNDGVLHETKVTGITDTNASSSFEISFSATVTEPPSLIKEVSFGSIKQDIEIAFKLGIIDNQGVANSLIQKLDAAETNAKKNKSQTAQNVLNALKQEIEAQRGKHINEEFVEVLLRDIDTLLRSPQSSVIFLSALLANLYILLSQLLALLMHL